MSASRRTTSRGGLLALAAIVLLAIVVFLLVVYALRAPTIEGRGELPGPAPTWTPQRSPSPPSTPSPSPAEGAGTPSGSQRLLALGGASTAIRAESGTCGLTTPVVSRSTDGGGEWIPVSFGATAVGEVLHLAFTSDTQVEAIVRTLPECEPAVLTSFTGGEFWDATPARLSEATYYDADSDTLSAFGIVADSPCGDAEEISGASPRAVLRCTEGLFVFDPASSEWQVLSLVPAVALGVGTDGAPILAAIRDAPECDDLGIRRYDLATIPEDGLDISCVSGVPMDEQVSIALRGNDAMLWSGDRVFTSTDEGTTWSPADLR